MRERVVIAPKPNVFVPKSIDAAQEHIDEFCHHQEREVLDNGKDAKWSIFCKPIRPFHVAAIDLT
jgi:hypothetical protein